MLPIKQCTVDLSFYESYRYRYQTLVYRISRPLRYFFTDLKINFSRPILELSIKIIKTAYLYRLGVEKRCQNLVTLMFQKRKINCKCFSENLNIDGYSKIVH